jgi:Signal transduction histidine kinase
LALAALAVAATGADFIIAHVDESSPASLAPFLLALLLQGGAAFVEAEVPDSARYFAALSLHAVGLFAGIFLGGGAIRFEYAVCALFAVGLCLFNPYPASFLLSVVFDIGIVAAGTLALSISGASAVDLAYCGLQLGLLVALVSLFAGLAVYYRELLLESRREARKLGLLVDKLTASNLRYQEYAQRVKESSAESERKRITRDIHDIVGYTLTNNITMMEAIIDIMHTNPLGVAHLVERARENAQEGLARIRESLYRLRESGVRLPTGFEAVQVLAEVFEEGTGVPVEFEFTNVAWSFPEEIELVFYHIVQESLINAFRHGKATRVAVSLARRPGETILKLCDNGQGAGAFEEGIGISGMRERMTKIGGSLATSSSAYGFTVVATLPDASKEEERP